MGLTRAPDRGDFIYLDFDPRTGHEQAGRRPALVLSDYVYHSRAGLAVVCPVTSKVKGYPFEVTIPSGAAVSGVVLADQVKSLDFVARRATIVGRAPDEVVDKVAQMVRAILGL